MPSEFHNDGHITPIKVDHGIAQSNNTNFSRFSPSIYNNPSLSDAGTDESPTPPLLINDDINNNRRTPDRIPNLRPNSMMAPISSNTTTTNNNSNENEITSSLHRQRSKTPSSSNKIRRRSPVSKTPNYIQSTVSYSNRNVSLPSTPTRRPSNRLTSTEHKINTIGDDWKNIQKECAQIYDKFQEMYIQEIEQVYRKYKYNATTTSTKSNSNSFKSYLDLIDDDIINRSDSEEDFEYELPKSSSSTNVDSELPKISSRTKIQMITTNTPTNNRFKYGYSPGIDITNDIYRNTSPLRDFTTPEIKRSAAPIYNITNANSTSSSRASSSTSTITTTRQSPANILPPATYHISSSSSSFKKILTLNNANNKPLLKQFKKDIVPELNLKLVSPRSNSDDDSTTPRVHNLINEQIAKTTIGGTATSAFMNLSARSTSSEKNSDQESRTFT